MSQKRYVVELTEKERASLSAIIHSNGKVASKKRMRAQVLLKVDQGEHGPGWVDRKAADAFDVNVRTVEKIREQLVQEGIERTLQRKKSTKPSRKRIFDTKGEEEVLAIATGEPPEGRARWTLRLLAGEVVRLGIAESVCYETVRKVLKKGSSQFRVGR